MNAGTPVIVKKAGFLSALAYGVFGFLTATVVCGTVLGLCGLYVVDHNVGSVVDLGRDIGGTLAKNWPQWREALPPILADAVNDRRAPEYLDQVELSVEVKPGGSRSGESVAVVTVRNRGRETVSYLSAHMTVDGRDGVPIRDYTLYLASPVAVPEADWGGPLLPGSELRFVRRLWDRDGAASATIAPTELRVWNRSSAEAPATQAAAEASVGVESDDEGDEG